ncbi:zinc ribbon domain-containing protein [Granulicella sp. WH15]|uniref:zinc ribbon domain-containing protein n=1 Tax=Granulicella sp. WH15 TaxID=2602070 RepID=UPI001366DFF0|nr:zinc ribbon domain-containing protein [Granulicella sp. WH15]QHN02267.1 zinc ribbon domain-containing protein [Granulicella sp. WH15]
MTTPWSSGKRESGSGDEKAEWNNAGDDLGMIPRWSIVLAVIGFGLMQYLFHYIMPHHKHELLPMRLLMGYSWGTLVASYVLLVGYVSRDVKLRKMPAGLWLLIVIVMPGGIGAVVYFLLRQPLLTRCPHCSTEISSNCHFCPQCQFQVSAVCGRCYRGVQITDIYCELCGHDLAEDHTPARLRAFHD